MTTLQKINEVINNPTQAKTQTCESTLNNNLSFTQQKNPQLTTNSDSALNAGKEKEKLREKKEKSAECENCGGVCRKVDKYYLDGGICKYGVALLKRRACLKAKIPPRFIGKTFGDYQVTPDNERAFALAKWFIAEKSTQGLYLYGNCGTGKTYLASLIAQDFISQGVIFGDVPDLMSRLKETFDNGGTEALLKRYTTCGLLVLDDIGTGKVTDWHVDTLYQIINARYNADKPLIVTSNYDFDDLRDRLTVKDKNGVTDKFTAKRITSRLSEMCIQAFFGLKDRRK